jgi:thiamine-phosphate pyrophosphorylase
MTPLIVISYEFDVMDEALLVNKLFEEGMNLFHLRKPLWDVDSQRRFLEKIKPEYHHCISVHQHYETISEYGLKYFHIRERDRKTTTVNKTVGLHYSTSFHDYETVKSEGQNWTYCFLSPIFNSISKKNHQSNFDEHFNIDFYQEQKVFALGGINAQNIEQVFDKGFYGAAILGAIWNEPAQAVSNFTAIASKCRKNVHMY